MNYHRHAPIRTRTGVLIGGAYIPRPKPEQSHDITGPHTKRTDWHELGHAVVPFLGGAIIALVSALLIAGVL